MAPILENPELRSQVLPLPVAAYQQLGELGLLPRRTELIRGIIFERPVKTPLFCFVESLLYRTAAPALGEGFILGLGQPLSLRDSCPEPDLAVFAGVPKQFLRQHPYTAKLVIEIAISTEALDRVKAAIYAEAGVEEYWIVLPDRGVIERFTQPGATGYAQHDVIAQGDTAVSLTFPAFEVNLAGMLAEG